ncbi:hypothetical protein LX36DRAFT_317542 [Colletotrichum falcatum]|nr:hypothetical protein LX36DRAFT_317542 [Colletotrichum falcatum]
MGPPGAHVCISGWCGNQRDQIPSHCAYYEELTSPPSPKQPLVIGNPRAAENRRSRCCLVLGNILQRPGLGPAWAPGQPSRKASLLPLGAREPQHTTRQLASGRKRDGMLRNGTVDIRDIIVSLHASRLVETGRCPPKTLELAENFSDWNHGGSMGIFRSGSWGEGGRNKSSSDEAHASRPLLPSPFPAGSMSSGQETAERNR